MNKINHRGLAINADLVILPAEFNTVFGGAPFSDKHLAKALATEVDGRRVVARVAPVQRDGMVVSKVGGERVSKDIQTVFGIRPQDWDFFQQSGRPPAGRLFAYPADQEERLFDLLARFERPATVISESPDEASTQAIGAVLGAEPSSARRAS